MLSPEMLYLYEKRNDKKKKRLKCQKFKCQTLDHLFTYLLPQLLFVSFLNAVIKREKSKKRNKIATTKKIVCVILSNDLAAANA